MSARFRARIPVLILGVWAVMAGSGAALAQTTDARTTQVDAAIAARQGDAALEACLAGAPAVRDYRVAVDSLANVGNPKYAAKFNCSGIGASWQEVGPSACCAAFERDKGKNADAAWNALQACGWRAKIEERRPAYLRAAEACLGAAAPARDTSPQPTRGVDPWAGALTTDAVRQQVRGRDAFAVFGGTPWQVYDTHGRLRPLPGYLADRVQSGYAVLNDRGWLQAALAGLGLRLGVDEALAAMAQGSLDLGRQLVFFGDEVVRHQLPGSSVRTMGGEFCSSEHSSIRGTINGGGDFIYCPLWEQFGIPSESGQRNWEFLKDFYQRFLPAETFEQFRRDAEEGIALRQTPRPGISPVAWRAAGRTTRAPARPERVWVELPTATVSSADPLPIVITDLASNGAAAVLVLAGRVRVAETRTGASRLVRRGEAVLVWPGSGVSQPVRASAERFAAAARPRIRGSIVLRPGERWAGTLQFHQLMAIESRLLWDKPAGAAYALEVTVNGTPLTASLFNKTSPLRYADGRNYPYREPSAARWMLFYSHDYAANNGPGGGGYEVRTDPGQAYRYVWDISTLLGGNPTANVEFRNTITASAAPLELRLLPTNLGELADAARGRRSAAETTPGSPAAGSVPVPDAKKKGLLGRLGDALDAVAKGTTPNTTTGATTGGQPSTAGGGLLQEVTEREPNNTAEAAMSVQPGSTVTAALTAGAVRGAATDIDVYRIPVSAPGRYTITVTPLVPECGYATGLSGLRDARGPSTMTVELTGQQRTHYTLRFGGRPEERSTSAGPEPRELVVTVDTRAWNSASDRGVQCVRDGAWHKEIAYRLSVSSDGAAMTAAPVPGSPAPSGQPHLAIYTANTMLAHSDFDYPVVVQLQDAAGRPTYPAAPLTVTVATSDAGTVRMYDSRSTTSATLTLTPPDGSGAGGLSWATARVVAAQLWASGSVTLSASAPGLPTATTTVSLVPTRTKNNQGLPAQTAPAARLRALALPPVVESDRYPQLLVELLDANGEPTGVDFGPGTWALQSSNPGVVDPSTESFRFGQLGRRPRGTGQTELTIVPTRPGVSMASASLTVIPAGVTATAVAPAAPAPTSGVVRGGDFGEPAVSAQGRVFDLVMARGVSGGRPVGIATEFLPTDNPIHVRFGLADFPAGTLLTSRWTYFAPSGSMVIGTGEFTVTPGADYGTFSYELAPGKRWPAGNYQVEVLLGGTVLERATFSVAGGQ